MEEEEPAVKEPLELEPKTGSKRRAAKIAAKKVSAGLGSFVTLG
jgi:hypothetical protein